MPKRSGLIMALIVGMVAVAAARDRAPSKHVNGGNPAVSLQHSGQALPVAARAAISAAIGSDQAAYHAKAIRNGFRLKNPQSRLQATFTWQGVRVESGKAEWGMKLEAYGTAGKPRALRSATPRASGNRVEYRRGALVEWYVNGPAGLEQGLTIEKAPKRSKDGILELALGLSGNMTACVDPTKTGLILSGGQGQAELRYTGLAARDAAGRKLQSWLELRGQKLLVEVATAGARYPLVVDPYIQVAKLAASDGAAYDNLGWSVSISADGSTVVAGAPQAKVGLNDKQGAVYVFVKPPSGWADTPDIAAKLTIFDGVAGDELGWSVSASADGSTVVAGAPQAKVGLNDNQGTVYVFTRSGSAWAPVARLTASDTGANAGLGYAVSISADGSTVVAGAPSYYYQVGHVYVFVKPGSSWYTPDGPNAVLSSDRIMVPATSAEYTEGGELGASVSISADGSVVVAGAPASPYTYNRVTGAGLTVGPGEAYVFVRPGGSWSSEIETAKLSASDGVGGYGGALITYGDAVGTSASVSADGSTVVAGAPDATVGSNAYQGAAYVFLKPGSSWSTENEIAKLTASDGAAYDGLGQSVSASADGSTVVAGANGLYSSGPDSAYAFLKPADGWTNGIEDSKLTASDGAAGDKFGRSVSVSADGSTVVAGAPSATVGSNNSQGAAYVFSNSVPFSSFDASQLKITLGPPSKFALSSSFILGGASDGINPLAEPVTLQIGTMSLAIPAGSFQQNKNGTYAFSGDVDGVSVDAEFKDLGANAYEFKAKSTYADLTGTTSPVTVTLAIGNDSGTWTGEVNIH